MTPTPRRTQANVADIRIKTRRPRATWPWLLVLALPFAYLLTWRPGNEANARTVSADTSASFVIPRDTVAPPDPVALLRNWATGADSASAKADARTYAAHGLDALLTAIRGLGAAGAPTNQKTLGRVKADGERIADSKRVSENVAADRMHDAAVGIADVIESANTAGHHGADSIVARVRVLAGDIHTTASLEAQRATVQQFLQATADAIAAMHPATR